MTEVQDIIPEVKTESLSIAVMPKGSVNSYTVQTVQNDKKVTVEVNYDVATNRTYVTDYQVVKMPVQLPVKSKFFAQTVTVDEKVQFIKTIKNIKHPQLPAPINVVSSTTSEHALYTETVLEVESVVGSNKYVKMVKYNKDDK